jgi:hypothetical protein
MKKTDAIVVRRRVAELGKLILADAEENVRKQVQQTVTNLAEHVIGRILYFEGKIEEDKRWLAMFKHKRKAIEDGEFTVSRTGTITFKDDTLERLG